MNTDKLKEVLPFPIGAKVRDKEDGTLYTVCGYVIGDDYSLGVTLIDSEYPNFSEDEYPVEDFELAE